MRAAEDDSRVEACIASVSFPNTTEALLEMIEPDDDDFCETHLQSLIDAHGQASYSGGWSAPRWFSEGDIFFFYHSKKALPRIGMFMSAIFDIGGGDIHTMVSPWQPMCICLAREWKLAQELGGHIFACARVAGPAKMDRSADEARRPKHWRSRVYASIEDVWTFATPLPLSVFSKHVTLSTGGGLTPVHGTALVRLRDELAKRTEIPEYLARATPGREGFRGINRSNWRDRTCGTDAPRFIGEAQLRSYFADFLLAELKDVRTALFQECRCTSSNGTGPIADYFVRIHGRWLPVEAKLSVAVERALTDQVRRYLGVTSFVPLRGKSAQVAHESLGSQFCLVVDSAGVYLMSEQGFVDCTETRPLVSRTAIGRKGVPFLREKLERYLR
jgi:hypothetical protein